MAKKCEYHNRDYSHYVKCGLDKDHNGDHAFFFKTHRQDIPHDHDWQEIVFLGYDTFDRYGRRYDGPRADAEYRCKRCGRRRLEYR